MEWQKLVVYFFQTINPGDEENYIHEGEGGYNAIHINAVYDLMN